MDINTIVVAGRLARDPETKFTQTGKAVTNFSIANDSGFGDKKTTNWINIVAWEKTSEFVTRYFEKGSKIVVQGRLTTRNYETSNGEKRTSTEVVADQIFFGDSKPQERAVGGGNSDESMPF